MDVFEPAMPILIRLKEAGHQAFIVGGSVRDYLMHRPINDIDIATSALPTEVIELFDQVIPVGIEHGTVIVRHHHQSFEVTTLREESTYSDYRHPDSVSFVDDITKDLARRDFTMNAIALTPKGELIDPFHGQSDIHQHMIRSVGQANRRFNEDPLRMLRAIRFSAQLGFSMDQQTASALLKQRSLINTVAMERIKIELDKCVSGTHFHHIINNSVTIQMLRTLPIFKDLNENLDVLLVNQPFFALVDVFVYLTIKNSALNVTSLANVYRLSNKEKATGQALVDSLKAFKEGCMLQEIMYHLDYHLIDRFNHLLMALYNHAYSTSYLQSLKRALPIQSRQDMAISGRDLQTMFPHRQRGPWIGDILELIEKKIITGQLNNQQEQLKEWVKWSYPTENA